MTFAERIYSLSPTWAQHTFVSAFGWRWRRLRIGGRWPAYVRQFRERESWTREQWRDYQASRLRGVLLAAQERVPHYRAEWERLGITLSRVAKMEPEELPSLPILTKDVARRTPRDLLLDGVAPTGAQVFYTSGSSGTPIATYWTAEEMQRSVALREARSAGWAGVSYLDSRATFSGRLVVPDAESRGPFHRYNVFERQAYFSAFHLGPSTVREYVAALQRYRPTWLNGYAYSYYTLARLALEAGLASPGPKAIVTTSEKVTPHMRSVMERYFGCKVYEEYGTVEDASYACECEHGSVHVSPDAGIVEIVDAQGKPVGPGQPGQVVVTGFIHDYQMFIRFGLGDEAIWSGKSCACGREMPIIEQVIGRIEDAVVGPDGREMVRFHGIFANQPHVIEGQIIQETTHDITAKVVPAPGFGPRDADDIRHRIHTRLTTEVRVTVEVVEAIPRAASGKFQAVIARVAKPGKADR